MRYRPEIDGLRAMAVVPVILFHAGLSGFEGGFVGVDVFFVISGFLITSIIVVDLEDGKFSFKSFYERRVRRLLPALIFVTGVCIPFSWLWMSPDYFKIFSGSLFANSLFVSNFFFMTQLEYFQPSAELQPLLHTWSLAIEEQYYLFFPAIILLARRFGYWITISLLMALVFGGIYLAVVGVTADPAKNYFHSGARLWEIGAGSVGALLTQRVFKLTNHWLAGLGVSLIILSIITFDELTPFPSLYTALPVLGTLLVLLFANSDRGVGRTLSHPFLVSGGLLSYSAYLWHQPLFAFARLRSIEPLSHEFLTFLSVLSFLLAYLTWRFVENPFRKKPSRYVSKPWKFIVASFAISATFSIFGLIGYISNGFPNRTFNGIDLSVLDQRLKINPGLSINCRSDFSKSDECQTDENADTIIWGDSYAMHLVPGLLAAEPKLRLLQLTMSGCAPLPGLAFVPPSLDASFADPCFSFNNEVMTELMNADPSKILLSSEFGFHEKTLWDESGDQVPVGEAIERVGISLAALMEALEKAGHEVFIISPPPEVGLDIGQCLSKTLRFGAERKRCDFDQSAIVNAESFELLKGMNLHRKVVRLDESICLEGICRASIGDVLVYRDKGHLSIEGSQFLGKDLSVFDDIFSRKKM
jgi:peptidoglycan/LPS O-acetylase OafA/YrhL